MEVDGGDVLIMDSVLAYIGTTKTAPLSSRGGSIHVHNSAVAHCLSTVSGGVFRISGLSNRAVLDR